MATQKDLAVSLIVPAYNIETYLPACLDSCLAQDFQDYEIILVDDGSTDQTPRICDDYAQKSDRITVIHQKNAGLSAARNTGIARAKGKYLAFVDGDDLVSPDFLSKLFEVANSTRAEIVICDFLDFSNRLPSLEQEELSLPKTASGTAATIRLLVGQENYDVVTWNKLYARELFETIKFPVGELHEDNLVTYKLLASAKKVAYLDSKLYYYRRREGSIMSEQDLFSRLKQKERAAKEAVVYFKNSPDLKQAAEISLLLSKFAYLDNLAAGRLNDKALWQKTVKEIKSHRYKANPYLTKKLKLYLRLLRLPGLYKLFRKIVH